MRAASYVLGAFGLLLIAVITMRPMTGPNLHEFVPLFSDIIPAIRHPHNRGYVGGEVGNVLLFMPLGAAFGLHRWSARRSVLTGLVISVCIETIQLLIPGRTTSVDDVIVNTLGTFLGWIPGAFLVARIGR